MYASFSNDPEVAKHTLDFISYFSLIGSLEVYNDEVLIWNAMPLHMQYAAQSRARLENYRQNFKVSDDMHRIAAEIQAFNIRRGERYDDEVIFDMLTAASTVEQDFIKARLNLLSLAPIVFTQADQTGRVVVHDEQSLRLTLNAMTTKRITFTMIYSPKDDRVFLCVCNDKTIKILLSAEIHSFAWALNKDKELVRQYLELLIEHDLHVDVASLTRDIPNTADYRKVLLHDTRCDMESTVLANILTQHGVDMPKMMGILTADFAIPDR